MKSGNVVMIIVLAIVFLLPGSGCMSVPQKKLSPVAIPVALQPQIEVTPLPELPLQSTPSDEVFFTKDVRMGGTLGFMDSESQSPATDIIVGGTLLQPSEDNTVTQPKKQFAVRPATSSAQQCRHDNLIADPNGQGWTHVCGVCGTKIRKYASTIRKYASTTCQSPAPQVYPQSYPQQPMQTVWQRPATKSDIDSIYEKWPILLAEQGRFNYDEWIDYGWSNGHDETYLLSPNSIMRTHGYSYFRGQKRKSFRTYPSFNSWSSRGRWRW